MINMYFIPNTAILRPQSPIFGVSRNANHTVYADSFRTYRRRILDFLNEP